MSAQTMDPHIAFCELGAQTRALYFASMLTSLRIRMLAEAARVLSPGVGRRLAALSKLFALLAIHVLDPWSALSGV